MELELAGRAGLGAYDGSLGLVAEAPCHAPDSQWHRPRPSEHRRDAGRLATDIRRQKWRRREPCMSTPLTDCRLHLCVQRLFIRSLDEPMVPLEDVRGQAGGFIG